MSGESPKASFWTTLPGLLSGAAALLTAIFAGYTIVRGELSKEPQTEVLAASKDQPSKSSLTPGASHCAVGGTWSIHHANGATAHMIVTQDGSMLLGKGQEGKNTGTMRGTVDGRSLNFKVDWSNQHTGVYTGVIDSRDRISGQNYDKASPTSQTSWFIDDPDILCATG